MTKISGNMRVGIQKRPTNIIQKCQEMEKSNFAPQSDNNDVDMNVDKDEQNDRMNAVIRRE